MTSLIRSLLALETISSTVQCVVWPGQSYGPRGPVSDAIALLQPLPNTENLKSQFTIIIYQFQNNEYCVVNITPRHHQDEAAPRDNHLLCSQHQAGPGWASWDRRAHH